jgi:hypothetical protein
MRIHRLVLMALTLVAACLGTNTAEAAPINVAEFRWETLSDPGVECPPADQLCIPVDPSVISIFSLTNIWEGPAPGPTLFDNRLTLPTGDLDFLDLGPDFPFNFDQRAELGIPARATVAISFSFEATVVSLQATLTQPDSFAVLQFEPARPVPEPATLALVGTGITFVLARRVQRRRSISR